MKFKDKSSVVWFLSFTGAFAVLAAFVFWGTWSPDVSPVMPDNPVCHPLSWWTQLRQAINGLLSGGTTTPADLIWGGYLGLQYWAQEFKYVVAGYGAALGLAYFLRGRGLSRLASYGAGLLLAFCGYWFSLFSAGHFGWFIWMTYGVFAFGLVDRAVRFGNWWHWVLLGACVAWASVNQPDMWLLFTVLTGAYTLAVCAWERRFPWKGMLLAALSFAVIGAPSAYGALTGALAARDQQIAEATAQKSALTGGAQADDKADAAAKAKADAEARWIFATNWSLPPDETFEFFISRLNGDTSCPMTLQLARAAGKDTKPYTGALGRPINAKQGNYRQHSLYVGWITCLLAVLGIASLFFKSNHPTIQKSKQFVIFFAVAAVLFWLFSMGRYCEPIYRIVYMLPFGDYLRAPVKWHHLTEFCLCVLAGFGIDALAAFLKSKGLQCKVVLPVVAAVVLVGAADLARIDKLYCAPIDMHLVRGHNAAADLINQNGKGTVADLIEGGRGLFAWSFQANEVAVTGNPNDAGVRFIWTGTQQVNQNRQLAAFLKARAKPVGYYLVTGKEVRSVAPSGANAALYQINGVPPPVPTSPWTTPKPGFLAMGILSLLGTIFACAVAVNAARWNQNRN